MGNENSSHRERGVTENEIRKLELQAKIAAERNLERRLKEMKLLYEERSKTVQSGQNQSHPDYIQPQPSSSAYHPHSCINENPTTQHLYPNLRGEFGGNSSEPMRNSYISRSTVASNVNSAQTVNSALQNNTAGSRLPSAPPETVPNIPAIHPIQNQLHSKGARPKTNQGANNNNVHTTASEFKCRSCNKIFGEHIYQCRQGHSACADCKVNLVPCAICRQHVTEVRNHALESFIAEIKIAGKLQDSRNDSELRGPCSNAKDGCRLTFTKSTLDAHLKECPFQVLACPLGAIYGSCAWRGKSNQIQKHFNDIHPQHCNINVDTEASLFNITDSNHIFHLIIIGNFHFYVHFKVDALKQNMYMTVQMVGTAVSANKWTYELHIYNKREPRRKYQYDDVCIPFVVPVEEIFRESKCAILPLQYAKTYYSEGGVKYKFYIKQLKKNSTVSGDSENNNDKFQGKGARRRH